MSETDKGLSIEIYSDVVCPWCYIGKRRLELALRSLPSVPVTKVTWRPFELNPTMPEGGMERRAYLEAKFGSVEAFRRLEEQVLTAGVSVQIPFAFEHIVRTPNTFHAHRLIWFADRFGCQDAVVDSLFRGYFVEGADVGSKSELVDLGVRAGLDPGAAASFLEGDEGVTEVKAEEAAGHRLGIRGVPYFVLAGAYGLSGAQPVERFTGAISTVRARQAGMADGSTGRR